MGNQVIRWLLFLAASLSVPSESAYAFEDYGIDMGSCAPSSGSQGLKASTNPRDFWFEVGVEIRRTLGDWGEDSSVCIFADREDQEWCVLTRRNMHQALNKCLATAEYMSRKHNRRN